MLPMLRVDINRPSPNFTKSKGIRSVRGIVLHTTQSHERPNGWWGPIAWFQNRQSEVSAHLVVEQFKLIQCVELNDVAWHAGSVNGWTYGVELCGRADQTADQWNDDYSLGVLMTGARAVAWLAAHADIPLERLSDEGIRKKGLPRGGVFGHVDANRALGVKKGHQDPGPNFPFETFLQMCREVQL